MQPAELGGSTGLIRSHVVGGYGEFAVPVELSPYVEVLWSHRAAREGEAGTHRVVPEPDVSLSYRLRVGDDGRVEPLGLVVVGPVRTARQYAPDPGERMYAVRLKPEWSLALLGVHPSDHEDGVDDFSALDPGRAGPLLERLLNCRTDRAILTELGQTVWGWAQAATVSAATETAHRGLELLRRARPGTSIQSVWSAWDGSSRHLRRAVRSATGSSPKRLLREKRLAAALYRADRTPDPAWSRIALACGYYDQSHLIRDCTELAGAPPGTIHRERRSQPEPAA